MGMTDSQFKGFVRFVLDDIKEVLENMPDGKEKEKLQKVADNLQQTLEDQQVKFITPDQGVQSIEFDMIPLKQTW